MAFSLFLLLVPNLVLSADRYNVAFSNDLERVRVKLCFDGQPARWLGRNASAGSYTDGIFFKGAVLSVSQRNTSVRLPTLPDDACISWQVDLQQAVAQKNYRLALLMGQDLVTSTDLWFWRGPSERDLLVDVKLPASMSISTPWTSIEDSTERRLFQPDNTPASWGSKTAVGTFDVQSIKVPGARIRLAAIGPLTNTQTARIRQWINATVLSVTSVHGRLPQTQPQVLV